MIKHLNIIFDGGVKYCTIEQRPANYSVPLSYRFSVLQTFVYLFAPICRNIKESDFNQNLRLQVLKGTLKRDGKKYLVM
jgi:hypothetical protein